MHAGERSAVRPMVSGASEIRCRAAPARHDLHPVHLSRGEELTEEVAAAEKPDLARARLRSQPGNGVRGAVGWIMTSGWSAGLSVREKT